MNTGTEAPASPDLSSLTPRERLNAAIAVTQGATWEVRTTRPNAWLLFDQNGWVAAVIDESGDFFTLNFWRDYAGDPSAWGALMEKEGVWAEPLWHSGATRQVWEGCWLAEGKALPSSVRHAFDTPGPAICAAVLARHGIDPTPYIGD
jgi:hypothetical protein